MLIYRKRRGRHASLQKHRSFSSFVRRFTDAPRRYWQMFEWKRFFVLIIIIVIIIIGKMQQTIQIYRYCVRFCPPITNGCVYWVCPGCSDWENVTKLCMCVSITITRTRTHELTVNCDTHKSHAYNSHGTTITTSCYTNGNDRPHSCRCIGQSIVFVRWRHGATLAGPHESDLLPNDISIGSAVCRTQTQPPRHCNKPHLHASDAAVQHNVSAIFTLQRERLYCWQVRLLVEL